MTASTGYLGSSPARLGPDVKPPRANPAAFAALADAAALAAERAALAMDAKALAAERAAEVMPLIVLATPDMELRTVDAAVCPAAAIRRNAETVVSVRDETIVSADTHMLMVCVAAVRCDDITCVADVVPAVVKLVNAARATERLDVMIEPMPEPTLV